jgi:hypothetical protein
VSEDRDLKRLDPDSEESVAEMVAIIAKELSVQLTMEDSDVKDPAWPNRIASLAADALLDRFRVLPRSADEPRYRWE